MGFSFDGLVMDGMRRDACLLACWWMIWRKWGKRWKGRKEREARKLGIYLAGYFHTIGGKKKKIQRRRIAKTTMTWIIHHISLPPSFPGTHISSSGMIKLGFTNLIPSVSPSSTSLPPVSLSYLDSAPESGEGGCCCGCKFRSAIKVINGS